MFWWVTVPSPMFGSHIDHARASSRPGSRYRYCFVSAATLPGAVSSSGTYASSASSDVPEPRRSARRDASTRVASRRPRTTQARRGLAASGRGHAVAAAQHRLGGEHLERAACGRVPGELRRVLERTRGEPVPQRRRRESTAVERVARARRGPSASRPVLPFDDRVGVAGDPGRRPPACRTRRPR